MPSSRANGTTISHARRKPKSAVSCRRYVQRNSGTPEQDDRPALDRHFLPRADCAVERARTGGELDVPAQAEAARGQREADRLAVRIEEQEERVVRDLVA